MAAPFAALEARVNSAVLRRVANATVTLGAATFSGIYDAAALRAVDDIVSGTGPQVLCGTADVSGAAIGTAITVNGAAWKVCGIEPDGTGMTLLQLRA